MENESLDLSYSKQLENFSKNDKLCIQNKDLFQNSIMKFKEYGLPTNKNEAWKYSKVKNSLPNLIAELDPESPSTFSEDDPLLPDAYLIRIHGNQIILDEGNLPNSSDCKVELLNLSDPFDNDYADKNLDSINFLNLASTGQVLKISVKDHKSLDKPIVVQFSKKENVTDELFNTRIDVRLGQGSKCEFIEFHPINNVFSNFISSFFCSENSTLNLVKILRKQNVNLGTTFITQDKFSNSNSFIFSEGGKLARTRLKIDIIGEGAHADVNGLYALKGHAHSDHYIDISHMVPRTTSNQLFKGILTDETKGAFTGKVYIARDAIEVDANQLNKNLLLSKKARVDTRPSLEVYADDVKCAHGATTGQLNEDELFYLVSRGIKKEKAYSLLIHGFINDALEKITIPALKEKLGNIVLEEFEEKI